MIKLVAEISPLNATPVAVTNKPPLSPGMVFIIDNHHYLFTGRSEYSENGTMQLNSSYYGISGYNGPGNNGWGNWRDKDLKDCLIFNNLREYYDWVKSL